AHNIIAGHCVVSQDAPRFANAQKRCRLEEVRILKTWHIFNQISLNVYDLFSAFHFSEGETFRIGTVDAIHPCHIHPYFTFAKTGNEDCSFNRNLHACILCLLDLSPHTDEHEPIVLSKIFGGDKVSQIRSRLLRNTETQLLRVNSAQTKHERRGLYASLLIAVFTGNSEIGRASCRERR